jgi:hypothetical protein
MCNGTGHHWVIDSNGNARCKRCSEFKHYQTESELMDSCSSAEQVALSYIDRKSFLSMPVIGGKGKSFGLVL